MYLIIFEIKQCYNSTGFFLNYKEGSIISVISLSFLLANKHKWRLRMWQWSSWLKEVLAQTLHDFEMGFLSFSFSTLKQITFLAWVLAQQTRSRSRSSNDSYVISGSRFERRASLPTYLIGRLAVWVICIFEKREFKSTTTQRGLKECIQSSPSCWCCQTFTGT